MRSQLRKRNNSSSQLAELFAQRLVGQPAAIDAIVPYVQMHQAGLSPDGRPIAVFMLLGPTGTGKTRTVEALAEVLHGNPKKIVKVDCGEFQMEHEIAKLTGAPPGYLGHRETQPMLNQQKLIAAHSDSSDISIVLFDEIEKAAPSMTRILLGILDKATLRLGDNTTVNFEKCIIFMTSNLGARTMVREIRPDFGFEAYVPRERADSSRRLQKIGMSAVRRKFSPEFVNRIDSVITYQTLGPEALATILDQQLADLQAHIEQRLGYHGFTIEVPLRTCRFLLKIGTSDLYGARELKRTIERMLIQPLALLMSEGEIDAGGVVRVEVNDARNKLVLRPRDREYLHPAC